MSTQNPLASFADAKTLLANRQHREAVAATREPLAYALRTATRRHCGLEEWSPWSCYYLLKDAGCFGGTLHRHLIRMLNKQRNVANGCRLRPRDAQEIVRRAVQLAGKVSRLQAEGGEA